MAGMMLDPTDRQTRTFRVVADDSVSTLGFQIDGLPPQPVRIREIDEGSWALSIGLEAGDELIAMNGRELVAASHKDLKRLVMTRPLELTVVSPRPLTRVDRPVPWARRFQDLVCGVWAEVSDAGRGCWMAITPASGAASLAYAVTLSHGDARLQCSASISDQGHLVVALPLRATLPLVFNQPDRASALGHDDIAWARVRARAEPFLRCLATRHKYVSNEWVLHWALQAWTMAIRGILAPSGPSPSRRTAALLTLGSMFARRSLRLPFSMWASSVGTLLDLASRGMAAAAPAPVALGALRRGLVGTGCDPVSPGGPADPTQTDVFLLAGGMDANAAPRLPDLGVLRAKLEGRRGKPFERFDPVEFRALPDDALGGLSFLVKVQVHDRRFIHVRASRPGTLGSLALQSYQGSRSLEDPLTDIHAGAEDASALPLTAPAKPRKQRWEPHSEAEFNHRARCLYLRHVFRRWVAWVTEAAEVWTLPEDEVGVTDEEAEAAVEMMATLRQAVESGLGKRYDMFEAVDYKSHRVAGLNYIVKVKTDAGGGCVHVRCYHPLPCSAATPALVYGVETGRIVSDQLGDVWWACGQAPLAEHAGSREEAPMSVSPTAVGAGAGEGDRVLSAVFKIRAQAAEKLGVARRVGLEQYKLVEYIIRGTNTILAKVQVSRSGQCMHLRILVAGEGVQPVLEAVEGGKSLTDELTTGAMHQG